MASDSRLLERLNLGTIRPLYLSAGDTKMRVECRLWRYRDPVTWEVRMALRPMNADEVAAFPEAKRISGVAQLRQMDGVKQHGR